MKWLLSLFAVALLCVGCGPSNQDRALSQVNVIARKPFDEHQFKDDGRTGETDPWKTEITWELSKGWWNYVLRVRSNGPDKLPYTRDDIVAEGLIPIPKDPNKPAASERISQGIARGLTKGVREGLKK